MNRFGHARKVLAASMFVMGACGIAYEYTLGALGNNLMGSSHEQIFVVIGLMMFAMGLGATLQKNISGDLVDKFLLVEILLGLTGGVSALLIYLAYVYSSSYMLLLWGFSLGIGILIGLEIPLLIRINREYSASLKTNLSEILSMDYVGSLAGALLFTFVLFANLSINQIAVALGCANLLLALLGLAYFRPLLRHFKKLLLLSCAGMAILGCLLALSEDWRVSLEQRTYGDPIIYSHTSRYQHIVMTRRNDRLSLFINGQLQFNSQDERIYHEMLVHVPFSVAPSRARILILGGGDGLALREVLKYDEVRRVDLVDIDPAMTDLAATHPDLVRLNRGALLDGRVTLRQAEGVSDGEAQTISRPSKLASLLPERHPLPPGQGPGLQPGCRPVRPKLAGPLRSGGHRLSRSAIGGHRQALFPGFLSQAGPPARSHRPGGGAIHFALPLQGDVSVHWENAAVRRLPRPALSPERPQLWGVGVAPGLAGRPQ